MTAVCWMMYGPMSRSKKDPQRTGYPGKSPRRCWMDLLTTRRGRPVIDLACGSGTALASAKTSAALSA